MYTPTCATATDLLISRARSRINQSKWHRDATLADAPDAFSCFTFIHWLWLPFKVPLPDHLLEFEGAEAIPIERVRAADLIFIVRRNRTLLDDDFGHVGVLTPERTVVHATRWRKGVVEDSLQDFLARDCLGVRRIRAILPP